MSTDAPFVAVSWTKHPSKPRPRAGVAPMTKEITRMLLNEELARARIQDLHDDVRAQPMRNERAARRWDRVARWASRRAGRYRG
ncbi:hypothetical protein GCM10017786_59100 [Amycolatopsis deserti]|uniref:Uncharacterized protein n=2 Tax=Amycolatopsis deserti TaxID=185696 RepID=A0ABQ3JF03_9PSEU|nr:hypothetical protein GCM10017786_59100 [Amycolatopsis deserti]